MYYCEDCEARFSMPGYDEDNKGNQWEFCPICHSEAIYFKEEER